MGRGGDGAAWLLATNKRFIRVRREPSHLSNSLSVSNDMKLPSSLLFIIGAIPSVLGSPSSHRPIFSVSPFGGIRDNRISALPDRDADGLRLPRGGSASPTEPIFIEDISGSSSSPLFSVDSTADILVQIFGLVNAFHGVALGLLPGVGRSLLGSAMDEEDELAAYAEESVGCFALEYGITGYLAASGLTTPEMAIGYGTLFDLYFLSKNLVNGKFDSFGVQNLMYAMTIISAAGTYGILADKLHLGPVLEILTVIPAVQGKMKYFDPIGSGKKKCSVPTSVTIPSQRLCIELRDRSSWSVPSCVEPLPSASPHCELFRTLFSPARLL